MFNESVVERFLAAVANDPKQIAIQSVNGNKAISYQDLSMRASTYAKALEALPKPARIAALIDDKIEMAACLLGCHLAQAIFIPVDARTTQGIQAGCSLVTPHAIVFDNSDLAKLLNDIQDFGEAIHIDELGDDHLIDFNLPSLDDPAVMLFTSGTTSTRKAVVLSHRAFAAPSYTITEAMNYDLSLIHI